MHPKCVHTSGVKKKRSKASLHSCNFQKLIWENEMSVKWMVSYLRKGEPILTSLQSIFSPLSFLPLPNQQRTLNKLPPELRCGNFLLISTDRACKSAPKRAKTCTQRVHIPTELPFCMPPSVVGCPKRWFRVSPTPIPAQRKGREKKGFFFSSSSSSGTSL